MGTIEPMAKFAEDLDKCFEAISKRAEYLLVANYANTLSKTVINKWDGTKLISSIEDISNSSKEQYGIKL